MWTVAGQGGGTVDWGHSGYPGARRKQCPCDHGACKVRGGRGLR